MADEKGASKGAKGIDGKKGEGFQNDGVDKGAQKKMYGPKE